MALQLNRFETFLARAVEKAEMSDFTGQEFSQINHIDIRGEVIRAIMLGLPVIYADELVERTVSLLGTGVRFSKPFADIGISILQAHIVGTLDLEHARRPDGASLPNLSLLACSFDREIKLSHACLRGLSLAGSHFSRLHGDHAIVEGSVDITGVRPPDSSDNDSSAPNACWVDFHGAKIGGSLFASYASLVAPPRRSSSEIAVEGKRNALDLSHCHVDSVILTPGFNAEGGVSLALAHVDGSLRLDGAHLSAIEGSALFAPNAEIRGNVFLRGSTDGGGNTKGFRAEGKISFLSATVGGSLEVFGGYIEGSLSLELSSFKGAVHLSGLSVMENGVKTYVPTVISKNLNLNAAKLLGSIGLAGVCVKGSITALTVEVDGVFGFMADSGEFFHDDNENQPGAWGIDLSLAKIRGSVLFRGLRVEDGIELFNTTIEGFLLFGAESMEVEGVRSANPLIVKSVDLNGTNIGGSLQMHGVQIANDLSARNIVIAGDVNLTSYYIVESVKQPLLFRVQGRVDFWGAQIGGYLNLTGAQISKDLLLANATVAGQVYLDTEYVVRGAKSGGAEQEFHVMRFTSGDVSLWNARIGSDLKMAGASIDGDLYAGNTVIGGDVELMLCISPSEKYEDIPFTCTKCVTLSGATISGNLFSSGAVLGELRMFNGYVKGDAYFQHRKVLKAKTRKVFHFSTSRGFNLWGSRIGADLSMAGARLKGGWSLKNVVVGGNVVFHQFVARFDYGRRGEYISAVFRSLFCAFIATIVGTIGISIADPINRQPINAPLPAWMPTEGVMVLDTGTIQTREVVSRIPKTNILAAGEKPCGDQISPILYSVDVLVPGLDLHQEARCQVSADPRANLWRLAFMLYALLGWALVSWLIFDIARIMASGPGRGTNAN